MSVLYIDCGMGAAGDMLTAALIELLPDPDAFIKELNGLGIPGVCYSRKKIEKHGVIGTQISVKVHGQEEGRRQGLRSLFHRHRHRGMQEIHEVVDAIHVPTRVKENILAVYEHIAKAESHAHGVPVSDIHFHEVGTLDAIADVTAVCLLMDRIRPEVVMASPIHVGCGYVRCAHGVLPVPAPATAYILRGVPIYGGEIKGELCTPTGAALLRHFASHFGEMPMMEVENIGYGMGKKNFDQVNCVRTMLGTINTKSKDVLV